jgi:DNA repair protein SbcC/Rad50
MSRMLQSATATAGPNEALLRAAVAETSSASLAWEEVHAARILAIRDEVNELLPLVSLPSDPSLFGSEALASLRKETGLQLAQVAQARADIEALAKVRSQIEVAQQQLEVIDEELSRTPATVGGLGAVLSEISSYIEDDLCPVCERDFGETGQGSLSDHVHAKVRRLSDAAERLLELARSRSERLKVLDASGVQEQAVMARIVDAKTLADMERRGAALTKAAADLEAMSSTLETGAELRAAHVAALRALSEWEGESADLAAARQTLGSFADVLGIATLAYEESLPGAKDRIQAVLEREKARLQDRLQARLRGQNFVSKIGISLARRREAEGIRSVESQALDRATQALQRGQAVREQGLAIRNSVDRVRSAIIRREFNDRLNRVWRDLFVRLAPGEPFVPAFRVPSSGTQRLEPKLVTVHRDGGQDGGTPGAMLSAGNLNTAALTLFIALHMSVPTSLPWLILDDPVQSMDDVHIAHFAALLRTLSKEHGRQVMIAVHDRQLFEYLRLELSPAFVDDSLITIELTRGARRDTICMSKRWAFQEETTLRLAA